MSSPRRFKDEEKEEPVTPVRSRSPSPIPGKQSLTIPTTPIPVIVPQEKKKSGWRRALSGFEGGVREVGRFFSGGISLLRKTVSLVGGGITAVASVCGRIGGAVVGSTLVTAAYVGTVGWGVMKVAGIAISRSPWLRGVISGNDAKAQRKADNELNPINYKDIYREAASINGESWSDQIKNVCRWCLTGKTEKISNWHDAVNAYVKRIKDDGEIGFKVLDVALSIPQGVVEGVVATPFIGVSLVLRGADAAISKKGLIGFPTVIAPTVIGNLINAGVRTVVYGAIGRTIELVSETYSDALSPEDFATRQEGREKENNSYYQQNINAIEALEWREDPGAAFSGLLGQSSSAQGQPSSPVSSGSGSSYRPPREQKQSVFTTHSQPLVEESSGLEELLATMDKQSAELLSTPFIQSQLSNKKGNTHVPGAPVPSTNKNEFQLKLDQIDTTSGKKIVLEAALPFTSTPPPPPSIPRPPTPKK